MAFHVRDGWWFERLPDGSVLMIYRLRVLGDLVRMTFTPFEWASIVASMSRAGETHETWQAALDRQIP